MVRDESFQQHGDPESPLKGSSVDIWKKVQTMAIFPLLAKTVPKLSFFFPKPLSEKGPATIP